MIESFARSLALVLVHEGGWADHPADPGGATMKGVTLATFRRYYGAHKTKADLRQISNDQLAHIYRVGYWDPIGADGLPAGLDYAAFDAAVNSGPGRALVWLRACSPTDAASARIVDLCGRRLRFLRGLSTWHTFGTGWSRRVSEVQASALQHVEHPAAAPASDVLGLPSLRFGAVGDPVRSLQRALGIAVDGVFGQATLDTLRHYQAAHGLHVDGVAGRQVWRALGLLP